jgi:hypothetical protein
VTVAGVDDWAREMLDSHGDVVTVWVRGRKVYVEAEPKANGLLILDAGKRAEFLALVAEAGAVADGDAAQEAGRVT